MSSMFEQPWHTRRLLVTQRLRQRRDQLGLTQKQVVTRLGRLGVLTTNRALSSLEHGTGLDLAKLPELAHALECTVTYLVGLTDTPNQWSPDRPPGGHAAGSAHAPPAAMAGPEQAAPGGAPVPRSASGILGPEVPDRPRRGVRP